MKRINAYERNIYYAIVSAVFCTYQVNLFDSAFKILLCCGVLFLFCPLVLSRTGKEMLKISRASYVRPFSSVTFCFIYSEALLLGACALRIAVSYWYLDLFLKIFLILKSVLSDLNVATPGFVVCLFKYFTFNLCLCNSSTSVVNII